MPFARVLLKKKIFLFFRHPEAGDRNAEINPLLGSCRRHRINPFYHLMDLFTRLTAAKITRIKAFTRAAWVKAMDKLVLQTARVIWPPLLSKSNLRRIRLTSISNLRNSEAIFYE